MAGDPTLAEQIELRERWDDGGFDDELQSMSYHHAKHGAGMRFWDYARKATEFDRTSATRSPPTGTRGDGTVRWTNPRGEFLVERSGKVVSYGPR